MTDQQEIDAHWAQVAATPWHRRNLRSVEELLTPPVSRWGRVVYYTAVPVVVALIVLSNVLLSLLA